MRSHLTGFPEYLRARLAGIADAVVFAARLGSFGRLPGCFRPLLAKDSLARRGRRKGNEPVDVRHILLEFLYQCLSRRFLLRCTDCL